MMKQLLSFIIFILLLTGTIRFSPHLHAQCNQQLVEAAAEIAGTDAIYIRDFKVKLSAGNMDNPTPTGKFPIYLNKGVNYRFSVANAPDFEGKAYFELNRNGQKYVDNYPSPQSDYVESVDFECPRSATYQLRINYGQGKEGCSALVLSMVYKDSMAYIEPGLPLKSDSAETIYLWTEHKIQIASSESRVADFRLTLSQGTYEKQGMYYLIKPQHIGELKIKVDVFEDSQFIESDSVIYWVDYPPLPRLSFANNGYTISKSLLKVTEKPELLYSVEVESHPYTLKSFYIADNSAGLNSEESVNGRLSARQLKLIGKTITNNNIYIIDAQFIDTWGNIHRAKTMEMVVLE